MNSKGKMSIRMTRYGSSPSALQAKPEAMLGIVGRSVKKAILLTGPLFFETRPLLKGTFVEDVLGNRVLCLLDSEPRWITVFERPGA